MRKKLAVLAGEFDGVPMYRECGCGVEFYGDQGSCADCLRLGMQYERRARAERRLSARRDMGAASDARELDLLLRHQERVARLRRCGQWLSLRLWIINAAVVVGGLIYLGMIYGAVWLEWLAQ